MILHSLGSLDVGGGSPPPTAGFVAECPKLTELSIVYPSLDDGDEDTRYRFYLTERVRSATLELANACKALPDFDTFQIIHAPLPVLRPELYMDYEMTRDPTLSFYELREELGSGKELVINCLKKPETECREGEGRKKTMVRVVELAEGHHPASTKVEEYEV